MINSDISDRNNSFSFSPAIKYSISIIIILFSWPFIALMNLVFLVVGFYAIFYSPPATILIDFDLDNLLSLKSMDYEAIIVLVSETMVELYAAQFGFPSPTSGYSVTFFVLLWFVLWRVHKDNSIIEFLGALFTFLSIALVFCSTLFKASLYLEASEIRIKINSIDFFLEDVKKDAKLVKVQLGNKSKQTAAGIATQMYIIQKQSKCVMNDYAYCYIHIFNDNEAYRQLQIDTNEWLLTPNNRS